ncbi:MAG: hypothetical protein AB7G12_15620 [Thermoanaerobaculia bacterium]
MRARPTRFLSFAVSAIASTGVVLAQPTTCLPSEATFSDCWNRIVEEQAPSRLAAAEVAAEVAKQPAGQDTGDTTLQSATKSFLPLAAMSLLLGQGDTNDDGDLVFDLNFLIPGGSGGKNSQLQAVVKTEPTISEALEGRLPESDRDALSSQLNDELGATDDVRISFSYNLHSRNHGRSFETYRDRFQGLLRRYSAERSESLAAAGAEDAAFVDFILSSCNPVSEDVLETRFTDCANAPEVRLAVAAQATRTATRLQDYRAEVQESGLDQFAALVANQPQFFVAIQQTERDDLAGGSETSGKLTYEWSRTNLTAALRKEDCNNRLGPETDVTTAKACLANYAEYVALHSREIATSDRFLFSLEYQRIPSIDLSLGDLLPGSGLGNVTFPEAKKIIGSLGYSRRFSGPGNEPIRLDIVANYEDVSGDPDRQDRLVATLTLTRKVAGFTIPLGIVYANHGEYLGEVNEELSAHIGLRFSLDSAVDKQGALGN